MTKQDKKLILSLTKKDFVVETMRGHGKGGQNRNTRDTAVRITHPASGAQGYSQDQRTQGQNKRDAFLRLANSKTFRRWLRVATGRAALTQEEIDRSVAEMMTPDNLRVEAFQDGKWQVID